MDYNKIYNNLIKKGQTENIRCDKLYEKHHIIPVCMNGTDEEYNIVNLTPEQHFTAHLLLAKIYDTPALWYACNLMSGNGKYYDNNITPNRSMNKTYGFIRRNVIKHMSISVKDKWAKKYGFTDYNNQSEIIWYEYIHNKKRSLDISYEYKIPIANVQRTIKFYAETYNLYEELNNRRYEIKSLISINIRKNITPEQEERRIKATKDHDYTKRNEKLSKDRIGCKNPVFGKTWKHNIVECPHCGKTGGAGSMKRWHFDNCKDM